MTTITEQGLFNRLVELRTAILEANEDIKQVKADAKYGEDNPNGIDKDDVALIDKSATLFAKKNFEEQVEAAESVFSKYKELTGYKE